MDRIKLICIDVDGTLVNSSKDIPQGNLDAICWAHEQKGVHIAINSGRIAYSTADYMRRLGIHESFPSLGGCVVQTWDGDVIEEHFIDRDVAWKINRIAEDLGCSIFVYDRATWYLQTGNTYWAQSEFKATGLMGNLTDIGQLLLHKTPNKLLGVCEDASKVNRLVEMVNERFCESVDCFKSADIFLEIMPKGINKGTAVNALCRHYGIEKCNVMSIGDYYNDVDMFKRSGLAVAMANSPASVKAEADYITANTNEDCGVAEAIRKFVI